MQTIDVYDQENRRDKVRKQSNTQNKQNVSEMGCQKDATGRFMGKTAQNSGQT